MIIWRCSFVLKLCSQSKYLALLTWYVWCGFEEACWTGEERLKASPREPFVDTQLKEDTSQLLWKGGGVQERVIPCGLGGQGR